MDTMVKDTRLCTIVESIIESCKETTLMRNGKKKKYLQDLWDNMNKWKMTDKVV